jgi:hypothetical protein
MSASDPTKAVRVFDLLLKFFGNGERWVRGRLSDRRGNCCLIGVLDFVSSHYAIKAEAAEQYLADEISAAGDGNIHIEDCAKFRAGLRRAMAGKWHRTSEAILRRGSLSDFNDGCKDFTELRRLILQARAAATDDADRVPQSRPHLDIESDELVMA